MSMYIMVKLENFDILIKLEKFEFKKSGKYFLRNVIYEHTVPPEFTTRHPTSQNIPPF